jgi:hypothetical protein
MPIGLGEAISGKDHHEIRMTLHHVLKTGTVVDIGRVTRPIDNQSQVVQHKTEFATDNPTAIRQALAPNLLRTATFPAGMSQFDPVTIYHSQQGLGGQELLGQGLMPVKQPK